MKGRGRKTKTKDKPSRSARDALAGTGVRPKAVVSGAADRPFGRTRDHTDVAQAIGLLQGRRWCLEKDCVSFDKGILIWDADKEVFRCIDWKGRWYRGASTVEVAIKAFDRKMRITP